MRGFITRVPCCSIDVCRTVRNSVVIKLNCVWYDTHTKQPHSTPQLICAYLTCERGATVDGSGAERQLQAVGRHGISGHRCGGRRSLKALPRY
jgi:hypothetical protein